MMAAQLSSVSLMMSSNLKVTFLSETQFLIVAQINSVGLSLG
jgi:hypothetical protein